MSDLQYSNVIKRLLESIPNIRKFYEKRIKELYADNNPHVIYGSIFVEYIQYKLNEVDSSGKIIYDDNLTRAFALLEELCSSDNFETRCLAETSVLESLIGENKGFGRFEALMGLETDKMARAVAANMGLG